MTTTKSQTSTADRPATASAMVPSAKLPLAEIGDEINTVFRAFADSTRLRILHLLVDDEICVGDMVKVLSLPQPTVSRHLAYLRKAALVDVRKVGLWSHYSLAAATSCFQQKLYDCLADCFHEVPELQQDAERLSQLRNEGGCCE
ncbi:ArsR/SmtB family transcription factor [Rhodopirellula halodulae]|uniref:ArsR/SmtB family transcription factor n=1 Tax=Rhodopirellula halodulae TaxID=2894198 RepID=UPI001E5AE12B|nr:metalloregulator ArsR/SmtB family transcription factor [Rhodopirellula sp. JC737]MCC9655175.1 metalloregulator ArsR/SmtB family transcription factor [Rhodopirellula sp. JC737]